MKSLQSRATKEFNETSVENQPTTVLWVCGDGLLENCITVLSCGRAKPTICTKSIFKQRAAVRRYANVRETYPTQHALTGGALRCLCRLSRWQLDASIWLAIRIVATRLTTATKRSSKKETQTRKRKYECSRSCCGGGGRVTYITSIISRH